MERTDFMALLSRVNGCTFAALDAETHPSKGIRKTVFCETVIVFTNKTGSGYERMVRRRLEEIGKDPESFSVSELPWGERIPETPMIEHRGNLYLQAVVIRPGVTTCFIGTREVNCATFCRDRGGYSQGLSDDRRVTVHAYKLESLLRLTLLGETLKA